MDKIIKFMKTRECALPGFPPPCDVNLFFGFFFDGTNNMKRDLAFHSHSNVARLYRAFAGGKDTHGSGSFPLGSVAHLGNIPPNSTEIVFPGVHSDIGGGYLPREQGRGTDPSGGDLMVGRAVCGHAACFAQGAARYLDGPSQICRCAGAGEDGVSQGKSWSYACDGPIRAHCLPCW